MNRRKFTVLHHPITQEIADRGRRANPTISWASSVDAAMRCGITCGASSAQSAGGSVSNTSRPAPPTRPCSMARRRAASSISSPRAVLISRMPGLQRAKRASLKRCCFGRRRQVEGQVMAVAQTSSRLISSTPWLAAISLRQIGPRRACRMRGQLRDFPADASEPRHTQRFPRTSVPRNRFFSHLPAFGVGGRNHRASAKSSAHACSATLMLLAPGALTTRMRRPPARRRRRCRRRCPCARDDAEPGAASMRAAVTVALRTMMASASTMSAASASGLRPERASTTQLASARSNSSAEAGRSSAITIFNGMLFWVRYFGGSSRRPRADEWSSCVRMASSRWTSRRRE